METDKFAERLQARMNELGLRQADVAARAGVSQGTVSSWLSGRIPRVLALSRLSHALGLARAWLLTGEGPKLESKTFSDLLETKRAAQLPDRLRWLRETHNLSIREMARKIDSDPSYLARLESGDKSNPSEEFLDKLISTFSLRRGWILAGHGEPFDTSWLKSDKVRRQFLLYLRERWLHRGFANRVKAVFRQVRTDDLTELYAEIIKYAELPNDFRHPLATMLTELFKERMAQPAEGKLTADEAFQLLRDSIEGEPGRRKRGKR